MAGRPKLSAEAHRLNGTYKPCRHEGTGVKFSPAESMEIPEDITDAKTIEVWDTIVPSLCEKGLVSIVEVPILEYAFKCYQNAQECEAVINNAGGVAPYLMGLDYKAKDLTKYRRDYMSEFNTIMFKFGVTPAENPKVRQQVKKDDNDVSSLLAMRGNL